MKVTLKLTGIYFKETLLGLFGSSKKRSTKAAAMSVSVLFVILAAIMGFEFYQMAKSFSLLNAAHTILPLGLLMGMFIALMININDTQGTMYRSKDYDMLMSLPLRSTSIITAKYLSTYLISLLYFAVIAIPTFVVYFIFNKVTALGIIFALVSVFFMPAFSHFISCIVGWIVSLISAKMRNKNIIRTILSLILAVGLGLFFSFANSKITEGLFVSGIPLWFKIVFANIYLLYWSIFKVNILYFFAALGLSVLFMVLGVLIISIGYKKINSSLFSTRVEKRQSKPFTYRQRTVLGDLYRKEATTFFGSPVYAVNGLMGAIMSIVVTIVCLSVSADLKGVVGNFEIIGSIAVFGIAMCTGIAPTTSVSVSMEGTKFQTLKALPIQFKDVALSKLLLAFTIYMPVVLICTAILFPILQMGVVLALLVLIYLVSSVVSQSALGLLLNLKFPRLNWTSETQAAKSGASMLLTMAIDLVIAILPMAIYLVVYANYPSFKMEYFMAIMATLSLALTASLCVVLAKKGEKMYREIQV